MASGEGAEIEMVSSHVEPESAPDPIAAETEVTTDDNEVTPSIKLGSGCCGQ